MCRNFSCGAALQQFGIPRQLKSSVPVRIMTGLIGRSAFQYFRPALAIRFIAAISALVRESRSVLKTSTAPGNVFAI